MKIGDTVFIRTDQTSRAYLHSWYIKDEHIEWLDGRELTIRRGPTGSNGWFLNFHDDPPWAYLNSYEFPEQCLSVVPVERQLSHHFLEHYL